MDKQKAKAKAREWLRRYVPAEVLGTATALTAAWITYNQTGSYAAATGAGWVGEGIGFYGYFITHELIFGARKYRSLTFFNQIRRAVAYASSNLLVEFLPAELLDNFIIRPFLMFLVPHYIHPYPVGFLAGKFSADVIFYCFAVVGYETRKRWLGR